MIQNFVTADDLRKREPELVRLKSKDEELEALIDKAFGDFCLQMREEHVAIPSTTKPIYFYMKKKVSGSGSVKINVDKHNERVINRFVFEKDVTKNEGNNKFLLYGFSDEINRPTLIKKLDIDNSKIQTFKFPTSYPNYKLKIACDGELIINSTCYIVESPFDTCIEFLALSYTFESLIKTADIYIEKADRYRRLYEDRFTKLAAAYSNGLYATVEIKDILR